MRKIILWGLVLTLSASLFACQGQKAYDCQDSIGCVEIAPDAPIRIAYALVTSGSDGAIGTDALRSIELALQSQGGTLLGHPIELVGEDSGCTAAGGEIAATALAADPTIVGVIGPNCSSEATTALPILSQAGLVMISPSTTGPSLTDPATHIDGYARTAHNDKVQAAFAAEFAYNFIGARTASTINDGTIYTVQLVDYFNKRFIELGGTVIYQGQVGPTDTDMSAALTQVAANPPDILFYPVFTAAGGQITLQARTLPALDETNLMGSDGMFIPDFLGIAGTSAAGMYLSSPDFTTFGQPYQDFLVSYEAAYGEKPLTVYHGQAYDATLILLAAIEKIAVVDADGTLHIGRQELRDAVYATRNYEGLTGRLTCTSAGDCANVRIAVYQVISGDPARWNPGNAANSDPKKIYP